MSTRSVRADQHGTNTGYTYGCRCDACRSAHRDMPTSAQVAPETVERVYAALEHEADMDGIVTATGSRLGELAGISQMTASNALRVLADSGRIKVAGTVGVGGVLEVHMVEDMTP